MPDSKKNAPKAGRRAKGALPSSAQNQVSNPSQAMASKTTRRPNFLRQDLAPIHVSGKVARTLTALISSGGNGITARQCGPWAYRLAAYVYVLRHRHDLEITMRRIQTGRSWHGRYILRSPVLIAARPH